MLDEILWDNDCVYFLSTVYFYVQSLSVPIAKLIEAKTECCYIRCYLHFMKDIHICFAFSNWLTALSEVISLIIRKIYSTIYLTTELDSAIQFNSIKNKIEIFISKKKEKKKRTEMRNGVNRIWQVIIRRW